MRYQNIVKGRFLDRPNRFAAHVELSGTPRSVGASGKSTSPFSSKVTPLTSTKYGPWASSSRKSKRESSFRQVFAQVLHIHLKPDEWCGIIGGVHAPGLLAKRGSVMRYQNIVKGRFQYGPWASSSRKSKRESSQVNSGRRTVRSGRKRPAAAHSLKTLLGAWASILMSSSSFSMLRDWPRGRRPFSFRQGDGISPPAQR